MIQSTSLLRLLAVAFLSCVTAYGQTTLIESGTKTHWKYLDDGSDKGTSWRSAKFKDTEWKSGPAPLGYGERGLGTSVAAGSDGRKAVTAYFRHTFKVESLRGAKLLLLFVRQDDGSVVYLNGKEVSRYNLSAEPTFEATAGKELSGSRERRYRRYEIPIASLVKGRNLIAAEVHQCAPGDRDLFFDLCLKAYKEGEGFQPAKMKPQARTAVESYWRRHYVGPDMTIPDGYVDGGRGMKLDAAGNARSYREILTVDRTRDPTLRKLLEFARSNEVKSLAPLQRAQRIAKYIDKDLAKPGGSYFSMRAIGLLESEYAGSELLLGQIAEKAGPGVCRHESLMFKILGDEANLEVSLVRGNYRHRDGRIGGHAWNELLLKDGTKMLVDLTRLRSNYSFMSMSEPKVQRYLNIRKQPMYKPDQAGQN